METERAKLFSGQVSNARLRGRLFIVLFGLMFVPAYTFLSGGPARYIVYLLPVLSLGMWFLLNRTGRLHYDKRVLVGFLIYCALMLISLTVSPYIDTRTLIDVFRPILYMLIFLPFMEFSDRSVRALTVIFGLVTVILAATGGGTTSGALNLAESQGLLESGLAFPLGGVLLYFLVRGDKVWALFAFVLYFIAFKRISFIGFAVVLAYVWMIQATCRYYQYNCRLCTVGFMITILTASVIINLNYEAFFQLVINLMNSQKDVDALTLGRLSEINIVTSQYWDQGILNVLFGNGPGDSSRRFVEITIVYPLQIHNSYLLLFYDYGVLGTAMFLLAFWVIYSRNTFGVVLFTYNLIIMNTDNTFTHHFHQITYFVLIMAMQYEGKRKLAQQAKPDRCEISMTS